MKQILTIAFIALLSFSCSKKDKVSNNELYGTSWKLYVSADNNEVLTFTNNSEVSATRKFGKNVSTTAGTYTYNKPNISILLTGVPTPITGTVNGNSMSLTVSTMQGSVTYIKQ